MGIWLKSDSSFTVALSKTTISSSSIYDETEDEELEETEDGRYERSGPDSEPEEREAWSDACRLRSLFVRDGPEIIA